MSDIIIYGKGKTGRALEKLLKAQGKSSVLYDDVSGFPGDRSFEKGDSVIVSPGVRPYAKGLKAARTVGAEIIGELDYCFPLCRGRCVSVTGTNGKTTTCEMIKHILSCFGVGVKLLGNGGVPFSEEVLSVTEKDVVVLESSSFQLRGSKNFSPFVSVVTNISQDHLDYHKDENDYINSKVNNFIMQKSSAYAVFNADDEKVNEVSALSKSRKLFYSLKRKDVQAYFDGKNVIINTEFQKAVLSGGNICDFADHNVSNALAAILACLCFGVDAEFSVGALQSYKFLSHRLQFVKNVCGVTFIDDSKATNVHACKSAVKSVRGRKALILGGSDKGENFDELFRDFPPDVEFVAAVGETAKKLKISAEQFGITVELFDNLESAVRYCFEKMKNLGGTVLMSNACASFDRYKGYAERGEHFQKIVGELNGE